MRKICLNTAFYVVHVSITFQSLQEHKSSFSSKYVWKFLRQKHYSYDMSWISWKINEMSVCIDFLQWYVLVMWSQI